MARDKPHGSRPRRARPHPEQDRDTVVNAGKDTALWIAKRVADGALPELGKAVAGWLIRAIGAGVGASLLDWFLS